MEIELKRRNSLEIMESHLSMALFELKNVYPNFDPNDAHNIKTPKRIAKMWVENFAGLGEPNFEFTTFPNEQEFPNWIIKKDIEFSSMCQHHFMPFYGTIDIGYIPNEKMVGLSKLDRTVQYLSARPQVQERLGDDIAHFIHTNLRPQKIVVRVKSEHTCVSCRGARSRNSEMVTFHCHNNKDLKEFMEMLR